MAGEDSGIIADLIKRLESLEVNNQKLINENDSLRKRISTLETKSDALTTTCEDLSLKVQVLREPRLSSSTYRTLQTVELLEQILLLCPTKQVFTLQRVCKIFKNVIQRSTSIKSRLLQNQKDAVSPSVNLAEWKHLWPCLRLNKYWKETWQIHPSRISIGLSTSRTLQDQQMSFRITDDLVATFEYRVTSTADTLAALALMSTSLGRSYLTQPALPTSVCVSFLDTTILRNKQEYLRACQSPATFPPNVTAQARIQAATVLEMLQVASMLHRYHREKWHRGAEAEMWTTKYALDEDRGTMGLLVDKPVYSGWRAVQPKSGHIVFDT